MRWLELVIDLIGVLAWPVVVLVILAVLREPLRNKLKGLLRLTAGQSWAAHFESEQTLNDDLAVPAQRLAIGKTGESEGAPEKEQRRKDIEQIILDSIAWGHAHALLFERPPNPEILWDEDERPRVQLPRISPDYETYRDHAGRTWLRQPKERMTWLPLSKDVLSSESEDLDVTRRRDAAKRRLRRKDQEGDSP